MDGLLIAVTVASLIVALVMSVIAWRVSNEEKQRAGARVAALVATAQVQPDVTKAGPVHRATSRPWRTAPSADRIADVAGEEILDDVTPSPAGVAVTSGFLGTHAATPQTGTRQRHLAAAAVVLAILLGGFAWTRVAGGGGSASAAATPMPLELLSLRHEREGTQLSVTGLVRNPVSAAVVERVSAVVLLFDPQGSFVTSATAPIDFTTLAGGDESPFVVRMQAPASVARYRVSFRTDGGSVTHVDRRNDASQASPVALTRQ